MAKFPDLPKLPRLSLPSIRERQVQIPLAVFSVVLAGAAAIAWVGITEPSTEGTSSTRHESGALDMAALAASTDPAVERDALRTSGGADDAALGQSVFLPLDETQGPQDMSSTLEMVPHDLDSAPAVGVRYEEDLPAAPRRAGLSERESIALDALTGVRRAVPPDSTELPPWRRYAALSDGSITGPLVAVVIDDLGHSSYDVARTMRLPETVTLAFLPYTGRSAEFAERAYEDGFEVLVHMPMEPMDPTVDPGPNALLTSLDEAELRRRLEHNLAQIENYVGINNHMGSRFTGSAAAMAMVLEELNKRGLLYLDSITSGRTVATELAQSLRMPHALRDVFIDAEFSPEFIAGQLDVLERMAREHGYAVGIGHPRPETLEALEAWLPAARARGIHFVPISTIAALECAC